MNRLYKTALFLSALFMILSSTAQDKVIHGFVTTFDSIPLIGAAVKVKSSKQVVLTDTLGNFTAVCKTKDRLKVSANGFFTQSVKLKSPVKLVAVNLKIKPGEKGRSLAIGYGHVLDKEKLNAVASLNYTDTRFSQYQNMYDLIRGNFAGVEVVGTDIIIRGVNSFKGSSSALIVLDGVIADKEILNTISPIEVKSINILKDGGSAIYGSRGANGVVIIETKKGGED